MSRTRLSGRGPRAGSPRGVLVFALSAVLSLTGAVFGSGEDGTLKEIAGYRQWTRVYEKPILVENLGFALD